MREIARKLAQPLHRCLSVPVPTRFRRSPYTLPKPVLSSCSDRSLSTPKRSESHLASRLVIYISFPSTPTTRRSHHPVRTISSQAHISQNPRVPWLRSPEAKQRRLPSHLPPYLLLANSSFLSSSSWHAWSSTRWPPLSELSSEFKGEVYWAADLTAVHVDIECCSVGGLSRATVLQFCLQILGALRPTVFDGCEGTRSRLLELLRGLRTATVRS